MLLLQSEVIKLDPLVVGQPVEKNETVMLKSPRDSNKKHITPKRTVVIKNGMTEQEMDESGEAWANHTGSYLTLAEVLAIEKAKQQSSDQA